MNKYICKNKRCKHEFYSKEKEKYIFCPVCNAQINKEFEDIIKNYNMEHNKEDVL